MPDCWLSTVTEVRFRPASKGDIPDLVNLLLAAGGELAGLVPAPFGAALRSPIDESEEVADLERALADPDRVFLVGSDGGGVAALGLGQVERGGDDLLPSPRLVITQVVVRADSRRMGLGTALLAAFEAWARERGLTALDLSVFEGNTAAAALFRKAGYRPLEHRLGRLLR